MRKRDGLIMTAAGVLIGTAMILPRLFKDGFSVYIGIGWLCESAIQVLTIILVYCYIREYRYRKLKGCKAYRLYQIPDAVTGLILLLVMTIYLLQTHGILTGVNISSVAQLSNFGWLIMSYLCGWFSNCLYINDRICYVPVYDKELELQKIRNYNIEKKTTSVLLLELVTEERSYKVTASKYMAESFRKAYIKEVGLRVY